MPSMPHCSAVPLALGTSIQIQLCGLVHWKSRMVPCRVTVWDMSNIAYEWCASTAVGGAARVSHSTAVRIRVAVGFMMASVVEDDAGLALVVGQVAVVLLADV